MLQTLLLIVGDSFQQVTLVKVNTPMASILSYENLLLLFVGSIINYFGDVTEAQPNKQIPVSVDLCQLQTMALTTVHPIHWPLPQTSTYCLVHVPRHKCDCSLQGQNPYSRTPRHLHQAHFVVRNCGKQVIKKQNNKLQRNNHNDNAA